jgi:hypothetical protein
MPTTTTNTKTAMDATDDDTNPAKGLGPKRRGKPPNSDNRPARDGRERAADIRARESQPCTGEELGAHLPPAGQTRRALRQRSKQRRGQQDAGAVNPETNDDEASTRPANEHPRERRRPAKIPPCTSTNPMLAYHAAQGPLKKRGPGDIAEQR